MRRASSSASGGWPTAAGVGEGEDKALERKLHRTIAAVGEAIDGLQFNKAVAQLYELATAIEKAKPSATRHEAIRALVLLVAPTAPHLAEECWAVLGEAGLSLTRLGQASIRHCWSTIRLRSRFRSTASFATR